jgi:hypothetical protein
MIEILCLLCVDVLSVCLLYKTKTHLDQYRFISFRCQLIFDKLDPDV